MKTETTLIPREVDLEVRYRYSLEPGYAGGGHEPPSDPQLTVEYANLTGISFRLFDVRFEIDLSRVEFTGSQKAALRALVDEECGGEFITEFERSEGKHVVT